ncbi:MAG: choice-of-anchor Q domain-containing protein [Agriterribacter sp.]
MRFFTRYIFTASMVCILFACKKNAFITDKAASITLGADTLSFDTVFTSVGSITQYFTIANPNDQKLKLDAVKLMGGANSAFKMNVDGIATTQSNNIEIDAGDSIYVFVAVTIDPSTKNLPFIVQDSIMVSYNGNEKYVQLQAYGQNAHFLRSKTIGTTTIWKNDLPYVISGGVLVEEGKTLFIEKGCRIYMHASAPFIVDGTLVVNGTKTDSVTFQGDRLDEGYRDLPASWPGIYFRETSRNNNITYGIIKNAYQGIIVDGPSVNASPKLTLEKCIIDNIYDAGITAVSSNIKAINCLISNCGLNVSLTGGGTYDFTYCTIASYGNNYIEHKMPVTYINNFDGSENTYPLNAVFRNCIVWGDGGSVENEMLSEKKGASDFSLKLENVLYKSKELASFIEVVNSIANQDPLFDSINTSRRYFDFRIGKKPSPAINAATAVSENTDLDGNTRSSTPDIGCYEKQ